MFDQLGIMVMLLEHENRKPVVEPLKIWHLAYEGKTYGPLTLDEAKIYHKSIPNGYARRSGESNWIPIKSVSEFGYIVKNTSSSSKKLHLKSKTIPTIPKPSPVPETNCVINDNSASINRELKKIIVHCSNNRGSDEYLTKFANDIIKLRNIYSDAMSKAKSTYERKTIHNERLALMANANTFTRKLGVVMALGLIHGEAKTDEESAAKDFYSLLNKICIPQSDERHSVETAMLETYFGASQDWIQDEAMVASSSPNGSTTTLELVFSDIKGLLSRYSYNPLNSKDIANMTQCIFDSSFDISEKFYIANNNNDVAAATAAVAPLWANLDHADTYPKKLSAGLIIALYFGMCNFSKDRVTNDFETILNRLYQYNSEERKLLSAALYDAYCRALTYVPNYVGEDNFKNTHSPRQEPSCTQNDHPFEEPNVFWGSDGPDEESYRAWQISNNPAWMDGMDETEEEYWDHTDGD